LFHVFDCRERAICPFATIIPPKSGAQIECKANWIDNIFSERSLEKVSTATNEDWAFFYSSLAKNHW
jgi:hypothetical protein